jgi:hypothetical protein
MGNQFSIRPPRQNCAPIKQKTKNIGYVMARVELARIGKNIDYMKAAGIPNDCEHQFF